MSSETRGTSAVVQAQAVPRRLWLYTLVIGVVVLLIVAFITEITDDTILVPNVIMVGSFLVPVCAVLFVLGLPRETHLTVEVLVLGFLAGGTAGVVVTAVTEIYVLPDVVGTNALIGLIEESGKILILLVVAKLVSTRVPRDGMVLGATVGAGFAAFETSGYALRVLIEHGDDHAILSILETEAFRGLLAPFGHITWTAILGGAVFASAWSHRPLPLRPAGGLDVPRRHRPARLLGRVLRLGDPCESMARRRGRRVRLAQHGQLGRDAHGRRPHALHVRLRHPARDPRRHRRHLGGTAVARLPDRPLVERASPARRGSRRTARDGLTAYRRYGR